MRYCYQALHPIIGLTFVLLSANPLVCFIHIRKHLDFPTRVFEKVSKLIRHILARFYQNYIFEIGISSFSGQMLIRY